MTNEKNLKKVELKDEDMNEVSGGRMIIVIRRPKYPRRQRRISVMYR